LNKVENYYSGNNQNLNSKNTNVQSNGSAVEIPSYYKKAARNTVYGVPFLD